MAVVAGNAGPGFVRLEIDGEPRLGVKISGHKRSMAGQLQSLRRGHGWIVRGDRIETWEISGLIEHEGAIYAYGPFVEHVPITDILSEGVSSAAEGLGRIVVALRTLEAKSINPGRYLPQLVLSLSGGGLLFLPRDVIDGVLSSQTDAERIASFDSYNHPDLEGERNACFLMGVLAYRAFIGKLPYAADTSEELHQRIREHRALPPHLSLPGLRRDLSDTIVRSFEAEQEVTLEAWEELLASCREEGIIREIDVKERDRLTEEAERFSRSAETGYRRRDFFRRNWRTMAIAGAIVVIVGAVGGSILKNALKPRITVGMAPEQVVKLFYTSMNSFNSQAMQDCVIDGAGKAAISEATNLFVISRVREGYEGTSGYVSAQEWLDQGKPKLKPGLSVYGVADLRITRSSQESYTVSYQKWQPLASSSSQQQQDSNAPVLMKVQGWQQQDRVYLKNEGRFWAIYRIDHLLRKQIGSPITVTNPALPASNRPVAAAP